MPLYEYQCDSCGHRFERIRKFSDPPVESCPACGGSVQKLISSPAFQFKGSGFYITDYPKAGKPDASEQSGEAGGTKEPATSEKPASAEKPAAAAEKSSPPAAPKSDPPAKPPAPSKSE